MDVVWFTGFEWGLLVIIVAGVVLITFLLMDVADGVLDREDG